MKKFITLFSLIALFFIGMQHTQAQEKGTFDESQGKDKVEAVKKAEEKSMTIDESQGEDGAVRVGQKKAASNPKQDAKQAMFAKEEAAHNAQIQLRKLIRSTELTGYQEKSAKIFFQDYQMGLVNLGVSDKGNPDRLKSEKLKLADELEAKLVELLSDEQLAQYKEFLAKVQY